MTLVLLILAVAAGVAATPALDHAGAWLARARAARRMRLARVAFPTLIDALASALRSGLSMRQAFAEIAPTAPAELRVSTERVAAMLTLGSNIRGALASYAGVLPDEDAAPLALVLSGFERSGGRVGTALERIAALLRGRHALDGERAALSAQGRASAVVLVSLAPLGALFFTIAMPDYALVFAHQGLPLVALAFALEILGGLWLWWIVRAQRSAADLASLLDALVVGLDAGLTFEMAVAGLLDETSAVPRAADVRRLLSDLRLGAPLRIALRRFARDEDETRVAALIAASSRFGSPLAHLLVTQADAMRTAERQRAEASARRLPVLMLFPLVLCILPALLIVFLGPPLLSLLS